MSYHAAYHHKITSHAERVPIVPVIDAHLHFVDFIQESDGIEKLIAAMDAGRFCLGSDLCSHFDHLVQSLAGYNGLLRRLTPRVRKLIASANAERIWFGPQSGPSAARSKP